MSLYKFHSTARQIRWSALKCSPTIRGMATVNNGSFMSKAAATMPPGYKAKVGNLETFTIPESVTGSAQDKAMGKALIEAFRRDGILQIASKCFSLPVEC